MSGALRGIGQGHPILSQFSREKAYWEWLGLRREDLANRPWREVEEYTTVIELILRENAAREKETMASAQAGRR